MFYLYTMINKDEYLKAKETVEQYEKAMILTKGIPCYVIYNAFDKNPTNSPIMVFTDKDMAERTLNNNSYTNLLTCKLYEPTYGFPKQQPDGTDGE